MDYSQHRRSESVKERGLRIVKKEDQMAREGCYIYTHREVQWGSFNCTVRVSVWRYALGNLA